jgi:hypothetical protein
MSDMNLIIKATDQASTALKNINGNVDKLDSKVSNANGKWGSMKKMIGAAAIAAGAFAAVKIVGDKINDMDALAKSARAAGAASSGEAFKGFQVLGQAMEEAGIDAATYDRALLQTTSRLKAGTEGQKSFAAVTDKLGDSIRNSNGELKSGPELLVAMTNALNEGKITTEDFAKVVGGRAGPLIQQQFASLNTSAEDLQATLDDVAANSNIVDLDAANNAEKFNDTVGRLKNSFGQLFTDALTPLMPVLADLAENILAAMPGIIDTISDALEKMKPLWKIIGVLFTDVIVPILGTLFDILGKVFDVIMPLYEKALPKLETAITTVKDVIQKIVDKITSAITAIKDFKDSISKMTGDVKDKISGMAENVGNKFDDMTGGMLTKTKDAVEGVKGWFGDMYDKVVGNSIVPDMIDGILREFDRQSDGMIEKTRNAVDGSISEYDRLEDDINDRHFGRNQAIFTVAKPMAITRATKSLKEYNTTLIEANELENVNALIMRQLTEDYNNGTSSLTQTAEAMEHFGIQSDTAVGKAASVASSIKSGFSGMADSVTGTFFNMFTGVTSAFDGLRSIARSVFSMISQVLIKAYIVRPLLAMMGIPMFAQGGLAAGGAPAIVGENGPELIVPSNNTRVFSNSQSKGILNSSSDTGSVTVNFNINAIDSQSGTEFLMDQETMITGMVQDAFSKRGRSGPYG